MKAAEAEGKYLIKAEVDAVIFEISRTLRDSLNNCASRLAADVAGLSTVDECEAVIEREHRAIQENMYRAYSAKLAITVKAAN
jgi:Leu/Phe-tRNA-protein transferase